jgi:hypothetical protein
MAAALIADRVMEELKPKLDSFTTVTVDVQKLTTHVEKLTTQLEEHTKKFEEHTKLMNAKFEKQKGLTNWSFYLLCLLPVIYAFVDLGFKWMVMMRIGESCSAHSDTKGEDPLKNGEDPLKCSDLRIIVAGMQSLVDHVLHLNQGAMTYLYNTYLNQTK